MTSAAAAPPRLRPRTRTAAPTPKDRISFWSMNALFLSAVRRPKAVGGSFDFGCRLVITPGGVQEGLRSPRALQNGT